MLTWMVQRRWLKRTTFPKSSQILSRLPSRGRHRRPSAISQASRTTRPKRQEFMAERLRHLLEVGKSYVLTGEGSVWRRCAGDVDTPMDTEACDRHSAGLRAAQADSKANRTSGGREHPRSDARRTVGCNSLATGVYRIGRVSVAFCISCGAWPTAWRPAWS